MTTDWAPGSKVMVGVTQPDSWMEMLSTAAGTVRASGKLYPQVKNCSFLYPEMSVSCDVMCVQSLSCAPKTRLSLI